MGLATFLGVAVVRGDMPTSGPGDCGTLAGVESLVVAGVSVLRVSELMAVGCSAGGGSCTTAGRGGSCTTAGRSSAPTSSVSSCLLSRR